MSMPFIDYINVLTYRHNISKNSWNENILYMDCHWTIFGEDSFWWNTDLHFSNAFHLNITIVEVNLSLQLNKAKIDAFIDNKISNQGQFYYCFEAFFGEDILTENTIDLFGIHN